MSQIKFSGRIVPPCLQSTIRPGQGRVGKGLYESANEDNLKWNVNMERGSDI